jgi:ubiquinone/menaquinone biosynthesis C-methylase UbiE
MTSFLIESRLAEKNGIYVSREIAERTVWDKLAEENPTHAVISAADEEAARKKSEAQIADIKKHVSEDTVLLDLGCGYGRVAQYLLPSKRLKRYIGVDSAYEMLQLFQKRYTSTVAEQSTPLTLVNADIHTLPIADKSVDVVIVCAVFLHNHKSVVTRAIEELKRVIKPGGTLLVYSSFPRTYTAMGLQGALYQGLLNIMGKPMKNGPVRYYSKRELQRLLKDFSEVEFVPDGFTFIPKTLIFLSGMLEKWYRLGFAVPLNNLLEKITPIGLKKYLAVHLDVVAKR